MFEKFNRFKSKYRKVIISNEDDRFKNDLIGVLEEIVENIKEFHE